jgi:hypothetical protein
MRSGEIIKIREIKKKEFGYLKGFFIGDGYKYHDKRWRKYYIEFYVNSKRDKAILHLLLSIFRKTKLNSQLYKDKRFNCIRLRIVNKEFYKFFEKDFKKMSICKGEVLGFISGMVDAEGYVNNQKSFIQVVNTNLQVLKFIRKELYKKGITSSINDKWVSYKMKKRSYVLYISVKFKRLSHLSIKAGYRLTPA